MRFTRVAGLCLLFALLLSTPANAQQAGDYRSTIASFNWTDRTSWQRYDGIDWRTPDPTQGYPGQNPGTGTVTIRNGAVVTINVSVPPPNTIGGLVVDGGGTLQFDNTNRTLNIGSGGVTVNAGGTFQVTSAAPSTTHTINITGGGSFRNDGTVNFRIVSGVITDVANLFLSGNLEGTGTSSTFNIITFNGTNDQTITIGGIIDNIQAVTYNNTGTAPNNRIINESTVFTDALTRRQTLAGATNISTFTRGNYVHDVDETYLVSNASITIPAAMTVTVEQGTMNFAHDNADPPPVLTLSGNLVINGGTVNASVNNTNTTNQFANSLNMNAANASITLNGGELNVGNTNTGFGNLRMSADNQSVTVNGGTLRTERWVIGSGNTDNHTVTINGGVVRILPTVTTTDRVALQFVQGTLVMNGGTMLIGENLTAIAEGATWCS